MSTPLNQSDNYNILSNREQFDDAKKKLIDVAKLDLLDTLDLDKKMVSRNNTSQALELHRVENQKWYPEGELEIRPGVRAKIDEDKYKDMLDEYKKLIAEKPEWFEMRLHQLDTELAEKLILDNNCAIEFKSTDKFISNKDAKEESKKTYKELDKNNTYKNKIERLMKTVWDEDHYIIKRTEEELKKIEEKQKEIEDTIVVEDRKQKLTTLRIGDKITITLNGKDIVLQKENEYGFICIHNESKDFMPLIGAKNSWVSNEDLFTFILDHNIKIQNKDENNKEEPDEETEWADHITIFNPEDDQTQDTTTTEDGPDHKTSDITTTDDNTDETPSEDTETKREIIRDLENKDPNYLIALQNKIEQMKNGEIIALSTRDGLIRLQKENEYGFICIHNEVAAFRPYVESDGEAKNSRVSKENLYKFLGIKIVVDPVPVPVPVPTPDPITDINSSQFGKQEVVATLSNTHQIRYAAAERKAGEEVREKWSRTSRWNAPQKLNLFLRRKFIKENIIHKEMKFTDFDKTGKLNRDEDTTSAADRHQIEEQEKFNEKIENIMGSLEWFEQNYPKTFKEIENLVKKFTGTPEDRWTGTIDTTWFQTGFEKILQRSSALDAARPASASMPANGKWARKPLFKLLSTNDMYQISTNLLEKITAFKGEKKLIFDIYATINTNARQYPNFANDPNQMTALSTAVDGKVRPLIGDYIHNYKIMPNFLKTLKINLDDPNVARDLINYSANNATLTNISKQTMCLKLQILNRWEEAYDVQEKLNWWARAGRWMDNPFSVDNKLTLFGKKFGKYLERHPWFKRFMGMARWVAKIWAMIAPGAITMAAWAPLLAYSAVYGWTAAFKTLLAKYSHYNKEHKLYQKSQSNELDETRNERETIANAVSGMHRWEGRFRGKKMKMRRQYKYYIKTSHDQLDDSAELANDMDTLIRKNWPLTPAEREDLVVLTTDGLARLDYHKKTWQNFLWSKNPLQIEKEYQQLQRLVLTSGLRLNMDMTQLRAQQNYTTITNLLTNGRGNGKQYNNQGYETARRKFKSRERQQAALGATKAGVVAFGISYGMWLLTGKWAKEAHDATTQTYQSQYELGKYKVHTSGNLEKDLTGFLNNTNGLGTEDKLQVVLTGSTDATRVAAHSVLNNPALLTSYKAEIINHVNGLVNSGQLAPAYGTTINGRVNAKASSLPSMFTGHESNVLASLRTMNGARDLADALAKTTNPIFHTGTIPLDIQAIGTSASHTTYNAADRFVSAAIQAQNNTYVPWSAGFGMGIGRDNTFAMNNTGEKRTQEDIRRYRSGQPDETRFNATA